MTSNPALHCLRTNHIWVEMARATDGSAVGGWCIFCGIAMYNGDLFIGDRYVGPPLEFTLTVSDRPLLA